MCRLTNGWHFIIIHLSQIQWALFCHKQRKHISKKFCLYHHHSGLYKQSGYKTFASVLLSLHLTEFNFHKAEIWKQKYDVLLLTSDIWASCFVLDYTWETSFYTTKYEAHWFDLSTFSERGNMTFKMKFQTKNSNEIVAVRHC